MTIEEKLYELGHAKESGTVTKTWDIICQEMNEFAGMVRTESYWRKKYKIIKLNRKVESEVVETELKTKEEEVAINNVADNLNVDCPGKYDKKIVQQQIRDERNGVNAVVRSIARQDRLLDIFKETIERFDRPKYPEYETIRNTNEVMVVMLSDIHYGLEYNNIAGRYNPDIAVYRLMAYESWIEEKMSERNLTTCYVSLMGDLVSGNIHNTTRVQNRDDLIEQIIGVSEAVAEFLRRLALKYDVIVNNVPGNHSRVDKDADEVLRGEKLDVLTFWYCKAKLERFDNVYFIPNEIDTSIGSFNIFGQNIICVHGDFEKQPKTSAANIEALTKEHIDIYLAAHLHVPDIRMDSITYITNGCVCGSGDDYSMKKRLFVKAKQVCFTINESGITGIYPACLED